MHFSNHPPLLYILSTLFQSVPWVVRISLHPHPCAQVPATFIFHLDKWKPLIGLPPSSLALSQASLHAKADWSVLNVNQTTWPPAESLLGFPSTPWITSKALSFARTLRSLIIPAACLTHREPLCPATVLHLSASLVPSLPLPCPILACH